MGIGDVETYAVIKDGFVINSILWDGNTNPDTGGIPQWPFGWVVVLVKPGEVANIGYSAVQNADGSWTYTAPPEDDNNLAVRELNGN